MIKPALLLAGALFLSAQHALAGDASGTDADPPLPLRVVITYPTSASHPRFQASFSAWTLAPIFAAASRQAAAGARSANQTARQSEVSATSAANQAQRQSAVSENQQRRQAVSSANEAQRQQASHENVETRQAGAALRQQARPVYPPGYRHPAAGYYPPPPPGYYHDDDDDWDAGSAVVGFVAGARGASRIALRACGQFDERRHLLPVRVLLVRAGLWSCGTLLHAGPASGPLRPS